MKRLVFLLALLFPISSFAQFVGPIAINNAQCAQIATDSQATVAMYVFGTWTGTLQPEGSIQGQAAFNIQVAPSTSTTLQSTITGNGAFVAAIAGYSSFLLCGNTVTSGTANVYLQVSTSQLGSTIGFSPASSSVFPVLGTSVNLTDAGSGLSIDAAASPAGTGDGSAKLFRLTYTQLLASNQVTALIEGGVLSSAAHITRTDTGFTFAAQPNVGFYSITSGQTDGDWIYSGGDPASSATGFDVFAIKGTTASASKRGTVLEPASCYMWGATSGNLTGGTMGIDTTVCRNGGTGLVKIGTAGGSDGSLALKSIAITDTASNSDLTLTNSTTGTIATANASPTLGLSANAFNGASTLDAWTYGMAMSAGTNATSRYTYNHVPGSTGNADVTFNNNGTTFGEFSSSQGGSLGIGTSAPTTSNIQLQIQGAAASPVYAKNTGVASQSSFWQVAVSGFGNAYFGLNNSGGTVSGIPTGDAGIMTSNSAPLCLGTNSTCGVTIDGSQNATAAAAFTATTSVTSPLYKTTTNCAAVGTAASPSLVACSAASSGAFSCATNASAATCVISTTAVTANSRIFVQESAAEGTNLSVTCNTAPTVTPAILLASKSAATSFTINMPTITVNPACFVYWIVN
jgi:hypothetical protein